MLIKKNNFVSIFIILIIVVLGVVLIKYFFPSSSVPVNNSVIIPTSQPLSTNTIIISEYTFIPSTLTVKIGDTITWINQDSAPHDIVSTEFTSPLLQKGGKFDFTFNTKGTFVYNCGIHPNMTGTIIVE